MAHLRTQDPGFVDRVRPGNPNLQLFYQRVAEQRAEREQRQRAALHEDQVASGLRTPPREPSDEDMSEDDIDMHPVVQGAPRSARSGYVYAKAKSIVAHRDILARARKQWGL